jgi:hypothetical protein
MASHQYPQYVTKEPVVLDGFQAILKPSEYGYGAQVAVGQDLIDQLVADREKLLSDLVLKIDPKKLKRMVLKPTPWEDVAENLYRLKFSWDAKKKPVIIDSVGTVLDDPGIKVYNGSLVKVSFYQKPYQTPDSYGTSIKVIGIQVVEISDGAPRLSAENALDMFGTTAGGFVADDVEDAELAEETGGTSDY